jgi:hypothetical protein
MDEQRGPDPILTDRPSALMDTELRRAAFVAFFVLAFGPIRPKHPRWFAPAKKPVAVI